MRVWSKEPPSEAGDYRWSPVGQAYPQLIRVDRAGNAYGEHVNNWTARRLVGKFQRIPSPAELAAMEACVEAGSAVAGTSWVHERDGINPQLHAALENLRAALTPPEPQEADDGE